MRDSDEITLVEMASGSDQEVDASAGFARSVQSLEFDQIRQQLAGHTRTVMGREQALALLPSVDLLDIATRQQETTEARQYLDRGGALEFGPDVDFRVVVNRALLGGLLRGEELYSLGGLVEASRHDRTSLSRHEEIPLLAGIADNLPDLTEVEREIRSAISPTGEVLDNASPALRRLREESRTAHERLNGVMERNLRRWQRQDLLQEPIITQRNGRLVLLIKAEMRSRTPGIVHDVSDSGATVFLEPMAAIDLGNRWREARLAEEREEERVLRQISAIVGRAGEDLLLTLDLLARLDLAIAKGRYSATTRSSPPSVHDGATQGRLLKISGARHPLLTGAVVPISLELGGDQTVVLITGPNAGGKTVTLKTVGLLALMAQAGLHVPADEARFPRFDCIYADIGDQQSIEESLSTFSSHIRNLLSIMERSTIDSLVLVDELGTSTDPEEGSALAKAILDYFQKRGMLLVATTHHREVARHVQEQPGMVNASVDLHPQTLDPTYQVTLGLPGRSYALTIAARLGLPPSILEQARESLSPESQATENLLRELQVERGVVDRLRQEAEAALVEARANQSKAEAQLAAVETSKVELLEETRQELQERISGTLARLQQAERSLAQPIGNMEWGTRGTGNPGLNQERSQLEAELKQERREITSPHWEPIQVQRSTWQERLKSGDRVFIRGIARPVEVITVPDEEGQVEVLLGTMRATIPVYQLERPAAGHQPAAQHGVYFQRQAPKASNTEIDLRGLRVDEALGKVEDLLNNASLDGVENVRIIHGKGTGALRRAIREYLGGHPLASGYEGGEGAGGEGVTVVELG